MNLNLEREQAIRLVVDEVNDMLDIAYEKAEVSGICDTLMASGAIFCALRLGVLSVDNAYWMLGEVNHGIRTFNEKRVLRMEGLA